MAQPNSVYNEASTALHGHGKSTHEANPEEHKVHQDTGDNPNKKGTNGNFDNMLQPIIHQDHQSPTKDNNQSHRLVASHIQMGKQILILSLQL